MSWLRHLRRGVRVLVRRGSADRELGEELQQYYEQEIGALMAQGLTRTEARRQARLRLGDAGNVIEEVRADGWERFAEVFTRDLRHAARRLVRSPGFTTVSVLTLGLGIGASTSIFSAVKPILLDPLPYDESDRLVLVADRMQDGTSLEVTFGTYREIAQRSRSFEALAALRSWQPTLTGAAQAERLEGQRVGADYFRVLRVQPLIGRVFTESEDQARGPRVVVLSHRLWQRRFAGDRDVIDKPITLNDRDYTVIGVLPADFENVLMPAAEVWAPLQYDVALPADGPEWGHHLGMVGRLARSIDRASAARELDRIARTPLPEFVRMPWASMAGGLSVTALQENLTAGVRPALLSVMGAVLLVLLVACVNVTNLLLARGAQRGGEMALRAALGAGSRRLLVQLMVETMVIALLGALAGLVVAQLGVRALLALSPPELPRVEAIRVDTAVFVFAFASAVLIGLVVGWFVARQTALRQLSATLNQRSGRVIGGDQRVRRVLVVAQVSLAVVLLVSGGLLLRSLQRLFAIDPGFDRRQLLVMQVQTAGRRFDDAAETHQFFTQALDAVRAVPGVRMAAFTSQLPLSGDVDEFGIDLESALPLGPQSEGSGFRYAITPDYFRAMRIPLIRGRLLEASDHAAAPRAILVNETFARRRFGEADPLGQQIRVGSTDQPWSTIVGIVGNVRQVSLGVSEESAVYLPTSQAQFVDRTLWLVARTQGDPAPLATAVRDAIWSVDKDQPVSRITTMAELVRRSAAERRFLLVIFDAFALAALALAAIGLYGVLAEMVQARVREIGVRAALGATRANLLRLIVGYGATLTAIGLALGLAGSVAAARAIRSLLFGITPLDPVTYAGVLLLMFGVCAAAACVPALRAARVHPTIALRSD